MSTPSPEAKYDWTFHYKLSKPVHHKISINDDIVEFEKEGENLMGFNIVIKNEPDSKAKEIGKTKAKNLERALTILSGMELEAHLIDSKPTPKQPGLTRVEKSLTIRYNIEGTIDKIDTTDPNIKNILNQVVNPELKYLSDAVAHKYHNRYTESIKEAFRVIDEEPSAEHYSKIVTEYYKYKCIRNISSHNESDLLHKDTIKHFKHFFHPVHDAFDFKLYDPDNRRIVLDSDSPKTKQTLGKVAEDLISEVRKILKL